MAHMQSNSPGSSTQRASLVTSRQGDTLFIIKLLYKALINFYLVFYSLHLFLAFLFACTLVATCQLEFIRIYGYGWMWCAVVC